MIRKQKSQNEQWWTLSSNPTNTLLTESSFLTWWCSSHRCFTGPGREFLKNIIFCFVRNTVTRKKVVSQKKVVIQGREEPRLTLVVEVHVPKEIITLYTMRIQELSPDTNTGRIVQILNFRIRRCLRSCNVFYVKNLWSTRTDVFAELDHPWEDWYERHHRSEDTDDGFLFVLKLPLNNLTQSWVIVRWCTLN
jgi:hypothetical protein